MPSSIPHSQWQYCAGLLTCGLGVSQEMQDKWWLLPEKLRLDASGSQGVSALGKTQKSHHFIERRDVELKQRAGLFQPGPYGFTGIE
jgi:ribosomal protein L37E